MKKFVLAPALAALAMFMWGYLYWGATTLPYRVLSSAGDDASVAQSLDKIFPATGTYIVPGMNTPEPARGELFAHGPFALVHFVKGGMKEMDPALLAQGYVHEFVLCFILAIMLCKSAASFKCFTCPVKYCGVIGLLVATFSLGDVIWWHHALSWQLIQALYALIAFIVAGVVLAFFFAPKTTAEPAAV